MNKHFKKILIGAILVGSIFSLTGCGGDKFEGEWTISYIDTMNEQHIKIRNTDIFPPYREVKIEKDGSKYLITETEKYYDGNVIFFYQPEKEYKMCQDITKYTGTVNGDKLVIDGMMGTQFYVYIDNNNTLKQTKGYEYRKKKDNDYKKYKEIIQKAIDNENKKANTPDFRHNYCAGKLILTDTIE